MLSNNTVISLKDYRIFRYMFNISVFIALIQQLPIVREYAYTHIRILLYAILGILTFYSVIHIFRNKIPKLISLFIWVTISHTLLQFVLLFSGFKISTDDIFQLLIPLGIVLTSYCLDYEENQLNIVMSIYVMLSLIVGLLGIYYYGSGFTITVNYFLPGKNQIGPILAISCIILIFRILFIDRDNSSIKSFLGKFIKVISSIALFSIIVVIRNRAGLLALIIVSLILVFKQEKKQLNMKRILFIYSLVCVFMIFIISGLFSKVVDYIWNSFTLNYDITDINSISANRTIVYMQALQFIKRNLLFGNIAALHTWNGVPHNYVLYNWVKYGVIGSLPIILFYLYLWIFTAVEIIKSKKQSRNLAVYLLLLVLLTSNLEYTHPYGPGVTQLMVWFMIGQYLKQPCVNT